MRRHGYQSSSEPVAELPVVPSGPAPGYSPIEPEWERRLWRDECPRCGEDWTHKTYVGTSWWSRMSYCFKRRKHPKHEHWEVQCLRCGYMEWRTVRP